MDEKRQILLDNCTRALCGDATIDKKLMDEATGGRFTNGNGESVDQEQIKTLLLALRWLGLPVETKTRKRRTTKKAAGNGAQPVVKRRGRPKGSKNKPAKKDKQVEITETAQADAPLEAKVDVPPEAPVETKTEPVETTTPPMMTQESLEGVTFDGGSLPQ